MNEPPMLGKNLNLRDAATVIDLFERAAEKNLAHFGRSSCGSVVDLSAQGRLLMTGDLHDNTRNYAKILHLSKLDERPDNYLILHEAIHGPGLVNGRDFSIRTLARIAELKITYPDQVILLQSNHELAQLTGEGIIKQGVSVVEAFNRGIEFLYGNEAEDVTESLHTLIRSLPLAVRGANGVLCSHSLPSPRKIEKFDKTVLDRVPTEADVAEGGAAHLMVWGRHHTQKVANELAVAWGLVGAGAREETVDRRKGDAQPAQSTDTADYVFCLGHQPAEMGYETEGETMLILASDHEHGVALPIDLSRRHTRDGLEACVVPLASVVL